MSIFRRIGNALARFMYGRNGPDQLGFATLWVCILLVLLVIASFVTQAIFGDIPWLRFFFNAFKKIGTESLLQ